MVALDNDFLVPIIKPKNKEESMSEQQLPTEKTSNIPAAFAQQNRQEEILKKFSSVKEENKTDETVEPTQDAKKVEQPATDFSKGFAALARKEKMLREKEESWKKERDTFKPKVDEYDKISDIIGKAKSKDPAAVKAALDILGLSAVEVSQMTLNDPSLNEDPQLLEIRKGTDEMRKELAELKAFREQKIQEEKEANEAKEYESSVGTMKTQISDLIKSSPDKYDLCSCLGDNIIEEVLEIGDDHYSKNNGEILSLDKILEMIETREEQRLSRFKTSKKFGKPAIQDESKSGTTSPTLTNKIETGAPVNIQGLTGDARMNALIKKFKQ